MVEVYLPFLLIMMSWHPADPQATMEVGHSVLIDRASCLAAGEETAGLVAAQRQTARQFAWRCVLQEPHIEIYRPLTDGQ